MHFVLYLFLVVARRGHGHELNGQGITNVLSISRGL
jgi:hypothetical protein